MSADLPFPKSLPDFQRLFPDDAACAKYLETIRFRTGFVCPSCNAKGEPGRIQTRHHVLRCRACRKETRLMAGTVMQDSHTPMSTWFWGAYLLTSLTPGMSAVQFQRQLGLTRYETAFQILHKLRSGMVRPGRDKIGGKLPVEVDETYIGGKTRGEGRGVHHQAIVCGAVEVCTRVPKIASEQPSKAVPRRGGRYAGRLRLSVVPNRTAKSLCRFVDDSVEEEANGKVISLLPSEHATAKSLIKRGRAIQTKTGIRLDPYYIFRPEWTVEVSWRGTDWKLRDTLSKKFPRSTGSGYCFIDGRYDMTWMRPSREKASALKKRIRTTASRRCRVRIINPWYPRWHPKAKFNKP